jgi:hypothetical protein
VAAFCFVTEARTNTNKPYSRNSGFALYDGFYVFKESLTNSRKQLESIGALNPVQKQFVGTLVDTEAAVGYFLKQTGREDRRRRGAWIAYLSVKMKYRGDLGHFAELIGHQSPSRSLNKNTITRTLDLRWSVQIQGVVAYTLLRDVRPFLFNEKSIIEVECILKHGPNVPSDLPHPFITYGAVRVRRGVWYWPQIDGDNNGRQMMRSG